MTWICRLYEPHAKRATEWDSFDSVEQALAWLETARFFRGVRVELVSREATAAENSLAQLLAESTIL